MRKLLFVFMALCALAVTAQSKLDSAARAMISQSAEADSTQTYNVIVEFDNSDIDFGSYKVDVVSQLDNMAIVNVTSHQIEEIANMPNVKSISLGNPVKLLPKEKRVVARVSTIKRRVVVPPPSPGIFGGLKK